jgi:hypothetical protein
MRLHVETSRVITRFVTLGLLIASGYLVFQRGGILAWSGAVAALLLCAKHSVRPSRADSLASLGVTLLWVVAWVVTWGYVRSTWESGEVVEIAVQVPGGIHKARVWVLDLDGDPVVYYDAPPRLGDELLADAPMTITRDGESVAGCSDATRVDDLSDEEVAFLFSLMEDKYQESNRATEVFYSVLGGERDRIGLLLLVKECS